MFDVWEGGKGISWLVALWKAFVILWSSPWCCFCCQRMAGKVLGLSASSFSLWHVVEPLATYGTAGEWASDLSCRVFHRETALSPWWVWSGSPALSDAASAGAGGFAVSEAEAPLSLFLSGVSMLETASDSEAPGSPRHF